MSSHNSSSPLRVRFAPSPTGYLHIGSLRVALFNYLFARHYNGTFLVRIEDTDIERSEEKYTASILDTLAWLSLVPDEPIVIQSDRFLEYQKIINTLIQEKKVYRCYCTQEEVRVRCKIGDSTDGPLIRYDGLCRSSIAIPKNADNIPCVIRFKMPTTTEKIVFHDLIHGMIEFDSSQFDDFVIARSDGVPMYNFVVVVDDAFMGISHIIRGDDHISNTPKQILLYQACGYTVPTFAHLPVIMGPSGQKLSKRDGAVSVLEYQQEGFLPDALLNYLVRLSWGHKDQEIFTKEEMISLFSLTDVSKKSALFDPEKLRWVNNTYIRATPAEQLFILTKQLIPELDTACYGYSNHHILALINLYKERVSTLKELGHELIIVLKGPHTYAEEFFSCVTPLISTLIDNMGSIDQWTIDILKKWAKDRCKEHNLSFMNIAQPLRFALIGTLNGPGVFELMNILGKERSLERINNLHNSMRHNT